ncbi:MAG TPA: hypothetical protein VF614_08575 [Chthoniobacteraceae bacterium]|jgi:hypothetical protein
MSTAPGPFSCPVCGEEVPWKAKSCPSCGACDKSGWSAQPDGALGLPDEDFDYEEFKRAEFGGPRKTTMRDAIWWCAAVLVLLAFVLMMIRH